jgi:hypothetical protein
MSARFVTHKSNASSETLATVDLEKNYLLSTETLNTAKYWA